MHFDLYPKMCSANNRLRGFHDFSVLAGEGFIEAYDIESAIKELGEERHKLKKEQAEQILEAAKLIAHKHREKGTSSKLQLFQPPDTQVRLPELSWRLTPSPAKPSPLKHSSYDHRL